MPGKGMTESFGSLSSLNSFGAVLAKNRCFFVVIESCIPEKLPFGLKNGISLSLTRGIEISK